MLRVLKANDEETRKLIGIFGVENNYGNVYLDVIFESLPKYKEFYLRRVICTDENVVKQIFVFDPSSIQFDTTKWKIYQKTILLNFEAKPLTNKLWLTFVI